MFFPVTLRFEIGEVADRPQQMLIHRIVMIHVELHQSDDAAEFRDEAAEYAGFVHQAQHDLRRIARGENVEEEPIGLGIGAQFGVDQLQRRDDESLRLGMNRKTIAVRHPEETDEIDRIAAEHVRSGHGDPALLDRKAGAAQAFLVRARMAGEAVEHGGGFRLVFFKRRADNRGQIADILGDQKIMFHETFDAGEAAAARIAESIGDLPLHVEAQDFLGAAGKEMQMAADPPEEFLAAVKQPIFAPREQAGLDEIGGLAHAVDVFGDPEQGVEIAQPAFALFHVRLDEIARAAGARNPRIPLN